MEERNVDLFDYFTVIYRRKILIIVVTLIGIGIGVAVAVKDSRAKPPPVTYHAEVVIKIGKKVNLTPFTGVASHVGYIQSPENLITIIPLEYWPKVEGASGYNLYIEKIGTLGMLNISMQGHDKGVERGLKELVSMLIEEHRKIAGVSVVAYKNIIKKLSEDGETVRKEIIEIEKGLAEMSDREEKYLKQVGTVRSEDRIGGDRSAFLNMLYLKTIDKRNELGTNRQLLRKIQMQLLTHRMTLGNLAEYKTEKFGEIKSTVVNVKVMERKWYEATTVAGVAGLIMSLFIAFFWEHIEKSKARRKGK
jgi:hypothetical protein